MKHHEPFNTLKLDELLQQTLETEIAGARIHEVAISCVVRDDLRSAWQQALEAKRRHVAIVDELLREMRVDPEAGGRCRRIVRAKAAALVDAMTMAREDRDPNVAQVVAAECVVELETKAELNWDLIGDMAHSLKGEEGEALRIAHERVGGDAQEHLDHAMGWARELWLESLGRGQVIVVPRKAPPVHAMPSLVRPADGSPERDQVEQAPALGHIPWPDGQGRIVQVPLRAAPPSEGVAE